MQLLTLESRYSFARVQTFKASKDSIDGLFYCYWRADRDGVKDEIVQHIS